MVAGDHGGGGGGLSNVVSNILLRILAYSDLLLTGPQLSNLIQEYKEYRVSPIYLRTLIRFPVSSMFRVRGQSGCRQESNIR